MILEQGGQTISSNGASPAPAGTDAASFHVGRRAVLNPTILAPPVPAELDSFAQPGTRRIPNALTIDFEDWFHGLEIPASEWHRYEHRIEWGADRLLTLLDEARVRATFFVLGSLVDRCPGLIRNIQAAGHEIGTHGWSHEFVYRQSRRTFREELRRSIDQLEGLVGERVRSHRACFFSINQRSPWAFEVLAEQGIEFDSSVYPVRNYRYGMVDAPRWPYRIELRSGALREFPISTYRVLGQNLPVGGGAYFRLYPYSLTRHAFRAINSQQRSVVFYLHPWELDPAHPRIPLPRRIAFTHYANLGSTQHKLKRLLSDFRFVPLSEIADDC